LFVCFEKISEEEKIDKREKLRDSGYNLTFESVQAEEYYKVKR